LIVLIKFLIPVGPAWSYSLNTPDNRNKWQAVGADAQVSKPNGEEMIRTILEFLETPHVCSPSGAQVVMSS
jgi:hypothetical protein